MNPTVDVSIHNLPTDLSVPITITIGSLKEAEQQERSPPTLLSLLGKSIAAFFDSEDGKSLDANLGIEAHRSNPLLQQFTRLGIEHAIEEVAADCAPTLAKELIAKLLQNLHIVQEPPNQTPEPKPVNPEHSIPTKHQDNQDEIKQTVTKQPPATNADMSVAAAEVAASITGFVDDSLGSFYSPDDERVQSVVSKATPRVHELAAKFHISQELVSYLLLLGLYDITVLFGTFGLAVHNSPPSFFNQAKNSMLLLYR